jgi:hypothetical protein
VGRVSGRALRPRCTHSPCYRSTRGSPGYRRRPPECRCRVTELFVVSEIATQEFVELLRGYPIVAAQLDSELRSNGRSTTFEGWLAKVDFARSCREPPRFRRAGRGVRWDGHAQAISGEVEHGATDDALGAGAKDVGPRTARMTRARFTMGGLSRPAEARSHQCRRFRGQTQGRSENNRMHRQ